MHLAQVAFSLVAGGAAILIIAGLVLEAAHDKTRATTPFVDTQHGGLAAKPGTSDPVGLATKLPGEIPAEETGPSVIDAKQRNRRARYPEAEAVRPRHKKQTKASDEKRRTRREERMRRRAAMQSELVVPTDAGGA